MNSRRLIVRAVCILIWGAGMGLSAAEPAEQAASDGPRLKMAATLADLGKVREGETLYTCFDLRNEGRGILRIRKVKAGCACTRVDHPGEIPGAGRARICLTIDTLGIHGRQTFKTGVYTDDAAQPVVILRTRADIAPLVTLTPDRCFIKGPAQSDLRREILIETRGRIPLEAELLPHDLTDKIAAVLTPVDKGKRYRLSVQNIAPPPVSLRGRLMLRTNYPGRERIVVPVFVHLPPLVAVYPRRLTLSTARCPQRRSKGLCSGELIVRAHDQEPLHILSLGPARKGLDLTSQPLIDGQVYRVTLRCPAGNGPAPEYLEIRTDRTGYDVIRVPVEAGGR